MTKIMRNLLSSILILCIMLTGLAGCIENAAESENGDTPPELPPDSSMTMDFSAFGYGKLAPSAAMSQKNFNAAAGRVLILDLGVIIILAPPAALFKAAQTTTPILQPNGSWLWEYKVKFLGQEYEANLTGRLQGFKTVWSMKVTNLALPNPLDNFEWYYGEAALDNRSGEWHFFDPATPEEANEVLVLEWSVKNNGDGGIMLSNTNERGEGFGDELSYSVDGTTATVEFFDNSENLTAFIEWDLITIAGCIRVPGYNGGKLACWNENKQDIP